MTKLFFENLPQLVAAHAAAKANDPKKALDGMPGRAASRRRALLQGSRPPEIGRPPSWLPRNPLLRTPKGRLASHLYRLTPPNPSPPRGIPQDRGGARHVLIVWNPIADDRSRDRRRPAARLGRRARRQGHVRHRRRLLGLPARHRGLCLPAQPGHPGHACRLPAAARLRAARHAARKSDSRQNAVLDLRRAGFCDRPLQLGRIRAAAPPQRFSDTARRHRRNGADRAGLRGRAPFDGLAARHHLAASSSPTASSATTCRRRFIHRGYDFVQIVDYFAFGTEGIYGTPVYVSAAYIFIFVVFAAFLERAGMIALFNDVALGLVGRVARRAGAGLRALLRADGHDLRLGRRQRGGQRPVHHPADETLRLPLGLRWRRGGDLVDGRADHAAGHGRGRLHHGRDAERALRRCGEGGDHPGHPLFRRLLLAGPSRGRQGRPWRHAQGRTAERLGGSERSTGRWSCRWRRSFICSCRLHADLRRHDGPGAHRRADPRRAAGRADRPVRLPRRLLDRARPGARRPSCASASMCWPPVIGALVAACLAFKGGRETLRICLDLARRRARRTRCPSASPAPSSASSSAR